MKSLNKILFLFTAVIVSFTGISAQELSIEVEEKILEEIEALHRQEQKAFKEGECEKVISFYDPNATFFTNGRQVNSLKERLKNCNQIPRPFRKPGDLQPDLNDNFYILSETAAYFVRNIDFSSKEDSSVLNREVVTKVWSKTTEGWKIVHFHSSIDTFPSK